MTAAKLLLLRPFLVIDDKGEEENGIKASRIAVAEFLGFHFQPDRWPVCYFSQTVGYVINLNLIHLWTLDHVILCCCV